VIGLSARPLAAICFVIRRRYRRIHILIGEVLRYSRGSHFPHSSVQQTLSRIFGNKGTQNFLECGPSER